MSDDRLDRLEQRVATLEGLVRTLLPSVKAAPAPAPQAAAAARPRPVEQAAPPKPASAPAKRPAQDTEQWVGQRLVLAVGVILVILAAAYMLKLAIDRGWISPALRCIGGGVLGVLFGAVGGRLFHRGLRAYGAALIGTGAAIVYLALWAAAQLYGLMSPASAIAGLAAIGMGLAFIAWRIDVQHLCTVAALGALFAPLVVTTPVPNYDVLLVYLAIFGVSLGAVAALKSWRITLDVVALTYVGVGLGGAEGATQMLGLAYALLGGLAALSVGLARQWWEIRLLGFGGGWSVLAAASHGTHPQWPFTAGAALLAVPPWSQALMRPTVWPDPAVAAAAKRWSFGETLYFYLTPVFVALTLPDLAPNWFGQHHGAVWAIVAAPYLLAGFLKPRVPFALAGTSLALVAVLAEWHQTNAVWALIVMGLVWASLDHALARRDGRWYALAPLAPAALRLLMLADSRGAGAAFTDSWAAAMWMLIAAFVALAAGLWRPPLEATDGPRRDWGSPLTTKKDAQASWLELADSLPWRMPALLWTGAGALLLIGITGELDRFMNQRGLAEETARLASGLSVSAWWALFAAGLVVFGFRRALRAVRVAGLLVAGLAVAKVLLFDLSELNAMYRVGSVFTLGLVSLLVAYLYHRQARSPAA